MVTGIGILSLINIAVYEGIMTQRCHGSFAIIEENESRGSYMSAVYEMCPVLENKK